MGLSARGARSVSGLFWLMRLGMHAFLAGLLVFSFALESFPNPSFDLQVPLEEIHHAVLREAIGVVMVSCWKESMVLQTYSKTKAGAKLKAPIVLDEALPVTRYRYDGVRYDFPATRQEGGYVQIVYDVKKNLRAWVRPVKSRDESCRVEYHSFERNGKTSLLVDPYILLGGRELRVYPNPSRAGKWHEYVAPMDWDGEFLLVKQEDGFGLIIFEGCGGKRSQTVGWVPMRDEKGRLCLWPCYWCGCC